MKTKKALLFSAVIIAALSVCAAAAYKFNSELPDIEKITPADLPSYQVVGIASGNSIIIDANGQRTKVKLLGITPAEKYHNQLAAFTKNLLRGETVCVVKDPNLNEPNDTEIIYGYVYRTPDRLFVNAEIIRQGYAKADKTAFKYSNEFQQLESFARERLKGIWDINQEQPTANTPQPVKQQAAASTPPPQISSNTETQKDIVYITKTGKKYHRKGCQFLSKSSIPIKLEDAKARGYTPCSRCCKE
jgi:endonuclease YncB( thermonuclease family)